MIAHTSGFKNAITNLGRDINIIIDYYTAEFNLHTEDNKQILTENDIKLLTELIPQEEPTGQITNDDIVLLNKNNLGELFRTYMKSYDLETSHIFNVGDKVRIRIGTTVNGSIEYLNYGLYYVYQKKYNEDTETYTYTLCDRMLFTMQKYDNDKVFSGTDYANTSTFIKRILKNVCGFTDDDISLHNLPNNFILIGKETLAGYNLTCRDVLDMIIQLQGCSLVIGYNAETDKDYIYNKSVSGTSVETIDDDILKNSNIKLGKKYGKINSLVFSRADGQDNIEVKDDESIEKNGLTQYVVKDNIILDNINRTLYINNLYNAIKDIEFYECNIDTIGLGYIEYLDKITIKANGNLYDTICLKNTSEIKSGMKENFTSEEVKETTQTYETTGMDDKVASINLDKVNGTMVLKVDSSGKIAKVRLDGSGESSVVEISGSQVNISGDELNLEGATTINDRFKIDDDGYMYAKEGGNIAGWEISDDALYKEVSIGNYDYQTYIQAPLSSYSESTWIFSTQKKLHSETGYTGTAVIELGGNAYFEDLTVYGDFEVYGSKNRVVDIGNKKILMNAYETTTPYFADIGSNQTDNNGICKIEIDKTFIQTIESDDYKVFIQECDDGRLYVEKHNNYFIVKGTPNIKFDWEIKAIQKGYKDTRMNELKGGKK